MLDAHSYALGDVPESVLCLRARCKVDGCVMLSYGTQKLPVAEVAPLSIEDYLLTSEPRTVKAETKDGGT